MVVHTQTERVKEAQQAVVEFLLDQPPARLPGLRQGRRVPAAGHHLRLGRRHARASSSPSATSRSRSTLSPLIAIDRERCILCYRCVRFTQEISEDYQLVLLERGAHTFVGTFDGHPYVAPFSGNIIELCPVGALTSQPYRFRARPWDIEGAGSVCTLCPAQCNVELTVRDERVLRVLARDHDEVDDGWLCDKGRFAYQAIHVDERITAAAGARRRRAARRSRWERALDEAAAGAGPRARPASPRSPAARPPTRRASSLAHLVREALGSADVDSRAAGGPSARPAPRARPIPTLQATVPDLEFAHAVLRARLRARRRHADPRPAHPQGRAPPRRQARGRDEPPVVAGRERRGGRALRARRGEAFAGRARTPRSAAAASSPSWPTPPARPSRRVRDIAALLRRGEDVVILYGERLLAGPRADDAARALLNVAGAGFDRGRDGAGPAGDPRRHNGRGLREAAASGRARLRAAGRSPSAAGARGDLTRALPAARRPARASCPARRGSRRWSARRTVVAHATFLTPGIAEHATVVFPAESYAERRARSPTPTGACSGCAPAIGRPGETRARLAGARRPLQAPRRRYRHPHRPDGDRAAWPSRALLRRHHARRDRRPRRALAGARGRLGLRVAAPTPGRSASSCRRARARRAGPSCALGTFRSIWAAPEVDALARAALPALAPARPAVARPTPSASELFDGLTATVAPDGARGGRGDRPRARRRARGQRVPRGRASAALVGTAGVRQRRGDVVVADLIATRRLLRALVRPDHQGDRDLRGRPAARAARAGRRAQAPRALPAPLRPQPRRPVRRRCSRWPTSSSSLTKEQFRPDDVDRLAVRAGADRSRS